jgi:37-kD nucleoid-associated bacterial protein
LAEATTAVNTQHTGHLRDKLTRVLRSSHAYPVFFDIATPSIVPKQVRDCTVAPSLASFVPMSQQLAQSLWTYHTGGVSVGLLCVLDVVVKQLPGVVLMKLEREEGAQLELGQNADGKRAFSMSVLANLVMTDGTRLFKSAMFVRTGDDDEDFYSVCCDDQSRVTASSDMARFWLQFLGCQVTLDAKVATERFYESTVRFINAHVTDPIEKNDLYEHLHSQLKSQQRQFVPKSFISDYVPKDLRQPLTVHLQASGAPMTAFTKDLADIESRIKRHLYKTKQGAVVAVPSDKVADLIDVKAHSIVVKDEVTSINSK